MKLDAILTEAGYYVPTLTQTDFMNMWKTLKESSEIHQYLAECGAGIAINIYFKENNVNVKVFGRNGSIKGADVFGRWDETKKFDVSTLPSLIWTWIDRTTKKYYNKY